MYPCLARDREWVQGRGHLHVTLQPGGLPCIFTTLAQLNLPQSLLCSRHVGVMPLVLPFGGIPLYLPLTRPGEPPGASPPQPQQLNMQTKHSMGSHSWTHIYSLGCIQFVNWQKNLAGYCHFPALHGIEDQLPIDPTSCQQCPREILQLLPAGPGTMSTEAEPTQTLEEPPAPK